MGNLKSIEKAKILFEKGLFDFQKEIYESAELNFLNALKLAPNRLSILNNLISVYISTKQKEKLKDILLSHKHLIDKNEIQYGKAYDHYFNKDYSKSIKICNKLVNIDQFRYSVIDLLASNFKKQKLFLEALKLYKKKLKEKKDYLIYYNIGCLFLHLGRINKAHYYFNKSKNLKKIDNSNLWNLSLCHLTLGNLRQGFSLYEYRWLNKERKLIKKFEDLKMPSSVEEIIDKQILISDEQGLGDTIQFSRFVIELLKFTKKITFVVNIKLVKLLSNLDNKINVRSYNDLELNNFEYHLSLCSLPNFLKIKNLDEIKYHQLYIEKVSKINIKKSDINIGLSWSGNPNFPLDEYRSLSLKNFKDVLNTKDVSFFKLSQDIRNKEITDHNSTSNLFDMGDKSLFEISQIMKELDLVVSCDTSIIHLAGILNIRSILLLNYNSDWRWFRDKKKTIWYPSVDIIKQEVFNHWNGVLIELRKRIEIIANKKKAS
tara:strand:+ start:111 stop:1574 length:1464 start_codon:yes stop_codon:yes gene_type:complete